MSGAESADRPEGERRTGVRFALVNCTEQARTDEFHRWYDTYIEECLKPGHLDNAQRYENPGSTQTGEDARFLAIYDTVTEDPGTAWPDTRSHVEKAYPDYPEYIGVVLAGTYAVVSSTSAGNPGAAAKQMSVFMADGDRADFDEFVSSALATETFSRASYFVLVEGFPPEPPKHLLILEDHQGTLDAPAEAAPIFAIPGSLRVAASFRRV